MTYKTGKNKTVKVKHPKPGLPHGQTKGPKAKPEKPAKSPPMRNKPHS